MKEMSDDAFAQSLPSEDELDDNDDILFNTVLALFNASIAAAVASAWALAACVISLRI
jgi:hypothetical protein